jgi:hypothetical protein
MLVCLSSEFYAKEKVIMKKATVFLACLLVVATGWAQEGHEHDSGHHAGVTQRGDQAMGFSHETTTHHFRLLSDGGAIEVTANDPNDTANRDMIRQHLGHIARMFAAGNFKTPMFIHDTNPPGVPTMIELREQIQYRFEEIPSGGSVRITTVNGRALQAVHEFLRFQIKDHETGDSPEVSAKPANSR